MIRKISNSGTKHSALSITSYAVRFFIKRVRYSVPLSILALSIIFMSKLMRFRSIQERKKVDSEQSLQVNRNLMFMCIFYNLLEDLLYRVYDFLSDVVFIGQQSEVFNEAFSCLVRDEYRDVDITNGLVQYSIREGSRAMAKLIRVIWFVLLDGASNIVLGCFLLGSMRLNRDAITITIFYLVPLACFFAMISAHIYFTRLKMKYTSCLNTESMRCDNSIYELLLNLDVVRVMSTQQKEINKFSRLVSKCKSLFVKYGIVEDSLEFAHHIIFSSLGMLLIYQYFRLSMESEGHRTSEVLQGARTTNEFVKLITRSVVEASTIYRRIKEAVLNSELVFVYVSSVDNPVKVCGNNADKFSKCISFKSVGIQAGGREILSNVNFSIKRGQKVAIIGKNGIGKSSIFKTMLGLGRYSGEIAVDGISLRRLNVESYRKLFAYVPQNNYLFDNTVYYNITYGINDCKMEDVHAICKSLEIHSAIIKMRDGYFTSVGERGEAISGGQRQKMLIARALLSRAPIFMFDEPFNNLDSTSVKSFLNILFGPHFHGKTVMVILHDYSVLDMFDHVIDLNSNVPAVYSN